MQFLQSLKKAGKVTKVTPIKKGKNSERTVKNGQIGHPKKKAKLEESETLKSLQILHSKKE